jgi:tRNA-dependent cyclodipeptide synthase
MNTSISQQKRQFNWSSNNRLLELPIKYFHPTILKVKINKPMTKLSWKDIEDSIKQLAYKIKESGFLPDYIVGITRGGLIPLYFLAKKSGINNVLTVSAIHFDKAGKRGDFSINYLPQINLKDKKVLLVDDIADSGVTLKGVCEAMLAKYEGIDLKTATIALDKNKSIFFPDYYVIEEKGDQIIFPWDIWCPPVKDILADFTVKLQQIRSGCKEELENKNYNLGIGISLGSTWHTVSNIIQLIKWSLVYTRENVVVYVADSIHAINLEVITGLNQEQARIAANKMGDELVASIQHEVKKQFSNEEIQHIHFAKWNSIETCSYKEKTAYLYSLYETDELFKKFIHASAKHIVLKDARSFSEDEIHRLGCYIIEEMCEIITRVKIGGVVCDALVCPYDSELARLVGKIQQGTVFPEIKSRMIDTLPKVMLVVR